MGRGIVMVQDPIARVPLLRVMFVHSVAGLFCRIPYLPVCPLGTYSWWTSPSVSKNAINIVLTLDFTWHTFFSWGDDAVFHWEDMKLGSFWACSRRSVQIDMRSSFCSAVRRWGTNFSVMCFIWRSSVRIFWHVLNAVLTPCATSLIDVGQCKWFLAHGPRSPQCGRWMACLGGGRLQRIGIHFWNGNTT